jgi:hypothetical protein
LEEGVMERDSEDDFGPDSWWAYWHDNPEDDEAFCVVNDEAHAVHGTQMQECLDEYLHGNCWTNRVKFFLEGNGDTER